MRILSIGGLIAAMLSLISPDAALCQTNLAASLPPGPPTNLTVPVPAGFDMRAGSVRPELDAAWNKLPTSEQLKLSASEENAKLLNLGFIMYAQDHDFTFPPMTSLGTAMHAVWPYVRSEADRKGLVADQSFQVNAAFSGVKEMSLTHPASTIVFFSKEDAFGYRTVGYADGHALILSATEWKTLSAAVFKP